MENARALSFGQSAKLYDDSRPAYPQAAVEWMVAKGDSTHAEPLPVLDLAAGTGKLTEVLDRAGYEVIGVEPDLNMSTLIRHKLPHVLVLEGRDTDIPLPDSCVSSVLVAQAWHWFDAEQASKEIARVLTRGGSLGILWNVYDESVDWVREFQRLLRQGDSRDATRSTPTVEFDVPSARFSAPQERDFHWTWERTPEQLVALANSSSWFLSLPAQERGSLSAQILELGRVHSEPSTGRVALPYVTQAYSFQLAK